MPTLGAGSGSAGKYLSLPQIDPSQILLFEGEFRGDWGETQRYMSEEYGVQWPASRHYEIQKLEGAYDEDGKKIAKFWKYGFGWS